MTQEQMQEAVSLLELYGTASAVQEATGIPRTTIQSRVKRAAESGLMGTRPVLPGFAIKSVSSKTEDGAWVKQTKAPGEVFEMPEGFAHKRISNLSDGQGRTLARWDIVEQDKAAQMVAMRAAVDALKEDLPRASIALPPASVEADLLNFYGVSDNHFGMLAWREETGSDYDLRLAEQIFIDWFAAAIAQSPQAHTAVFGQLGDLMHHDSLESVTPAHRHVLDADSRLQKIIRVVIRCMRQVIDMLLQKHQHVHVIMASGNHDPASSAWLREMFATIYENEPRISVDNSPSLYYAYEWGDTALFMHHGHKRNISNVDVTFAGMFREMFGRSKYAYGHIGHLHSDEGRKSGLMYIERHETLAAPDAYAAGGGWLSGRSAKVITYSKRFGEVGRHILRPEMVAGAYRAANDNQPQAKAA
jgi:hypothetical protein